MKYYHVQNCLTIGILLLSVVIGTFRFRLMDTATRILYGLLAAALLTECIAYYMAIYQHNNMPVYSFFSIIEIVLVAFYFNYSLALLKRRKIGLYIAAGGMVAGIINNVWLQSINATNSYFLVTEGLTVISLSLLSVTQFLNHSYLRLKTSPHFWFAIIFLFFWTTTILNWLLYDYFTDWIKDDKWIIDIFVYLISLATNFCFAVIFFLYPKMNHRNGQ